MADRDEFESVPSFFTRVDQIVDSHLGKSSHGGLFLVKPLYYSNGAATFKYDLERNLETVNFRWFYYRVFDTSAFEGPWQLESASEAAFPTGRVLRSMSHEDTHKWDWEQEDISHWTWKQGGAELSGSYEFPLDIESAKRLKGNMDGFIVVELDYEARNKAVLDPIVKWGNLPRLNMVGFVVVDRTTSGVIKEFRDKPPK